MVKLSKCRQWSCSADEDESLLFFTPFSVTDILQLTVFTPQTPPDPAPLWPHCATHDCTLIISRIVTVIQCDSVYTWTTFPSLYTMYSVYSVVQHDTDHWSGACYQNMSQYVLQIMHDILGLIHWNISSTDHWPLCCTWVLMMPAVMTTPRLTSDHRYCSSPGAPATLNTFRSNIFEATSHLDCTTSTHTLLSIMHWKLCWVWVMLVLWQLIAG